MCEGEQAGAAFDALLEPTTLTSFVVALAPRREGAATRVTEKGAFTYDTYAAILQPTLVITAPGLSERYSEARTLLLSQHFVGPSCAHGDTYVHTIASVAQQSAV